MKVTLLRKEMIAEGTLYAEFVTGGEEITFQPGQFFRLTLPEMLYSDERGDSRFFGFVNTPRQKGVAATVTRMGPSAFKRTLGDMDTGKEAELSGIDGKMILPEEEGKEMVIMTGGIGIAPVISLLRHVKENSIDRKITLVYTNTNRARALYMDEISGYAAQNPNFVFVPTMTQDQTWGGETRRIDKQFLEEKLTIGGEQIFYITGTPRFVPAMVKNLRETGVQPSNMKFEIFTGY